MKLIYLLSIFLIFISCNNRNRGSTEIEGILRMADDNRKELETVLQLKPRQLYIIANDELLLYKTIYVCSRRFAINTDNNSKKCIT
jgi:hypothetical protein